MGALFDFLSFIDVHNKQCQNILDLEMVWLTKSSYTRNLTIFTGMSCVDIQCCDESNHDADSLSGHCKDGEGDFDIKEVVNFTGRPLKTCKLK